MRSTELSILYSALTNKEKMFKLLQSDSGIFYESDLRWCLNVVRDIMATKGNIDTLIFNTEIESRKTNGINPKNIMAELLSALPCYNFDTVINQLEDRQRKDNIKNNAEKIIDAINSNSLDYDMAIDRLIIDYETGKSETYVEFCDWINENGLDDIFKKMEVTRTNLKPIDDKIYGVYGGQLILIAARPGVGKTSLAIEMTTRMNEPVLFFSLEMNRHEIYAKMLSSMASVESWKILFNKMTDQERTRVMKSHDHIKTSAKLTLFDIPLDLRRVVYYINHHVLLKRPRAIFVDYIQLLSGAKGENENVRVGIISRTLKLMAMKHKIPIFALSQLSRANAKEKRKPELSDLRGSGSLEQDANIVIFLYEDDNGETIGSVAKARMSKTGRLDGLKFEKEYGRFIDMRETSDVKLFGYE